MEELNKVLKRDDWNDYVIRCEGKRIQLFVNGMRTVDFTEPDDKIENYGVIAVQIHSGPPSEDRKSTRLNSSHSQISYAVFCLKKKKKKKKQNNLYLNEIITNKESKLRN